HVPALSGLLPPSPAPPGSGCPQLHRPAATGSAAKVSHLHSNHCASRRTHDLRHTAASLLFSAGVDLNEIRALLRHTRLATTADIYVDILDEVRRSTARSMDDILTRLHRPSATDSNEDGEGDQVMKS
ncbi:tyrosine-type recombinase/integrase, partial [Parafrankia sp. FMc2]|uniref:tyrosine-type recombinase/integrase n=1 Tax=Parafrankia sp. FMc2 TaxID=3233196 RepID=UPI0034D6C0F1